jgi:hypothetical protein
MLEVRRRSMWVLVRDRPAAIKVPKEEYGAHLASDQPTLVILIVMTMTSIVLGNAIAITVRIEHLSFAKTSFGRIPQEHFEETHGLDGRSHRPNCTASGSFRWSAHDPEAVMGRGSCIRKFLTRARSE